MDVKSGCFQGGVTSPVFFNIYISELSEMLSSFILQFADDLTLVYPIFNINDCQTVQNDLDIIYNFCQDNHLKLNPEKCVSMRVTLKNTQLFEYKINEIPTKKCFK